MTTLVLSVRINEDERALLESASERAGMSVIEFVRRKALEAAEIDVMNRRVVTIPAKDWAAFEAWADRPPRAIKRLKEAARKTPGTRAGGRDRLGNRR